MRIRQTVRGLGYALVAMLFAWAGLSFPIHFRSVSPLILEEAALDTPSVESLAADYIDRGQTGPARMLLAALPPSPQHLDLERTLTAMEERQPLLALYGESATELQALLASYLIDPWSRPDTLTLLLPSSHRETLKARLQQSEKPTVKFLLRTSTLQSYEQFLPLSSNAGQPLEAVILLAALLSEEGIWTDMLDRALLERSTVALKNPAELPLLEDVYTALLTLASRTNWAQLTALLKPLPDLDALQKLHAAAQLAGDQFPQLYTASLLTRKPEAVAAYVLERGEDAWDVMQVANAYGEGAALAMLDFFQPLYLPPAYLRLGPLERSQQGLRTFTEANPLIAKILKASTLCLAGYFLTLALGAGLSFWLKADHRLARGQLVHLFHAVAGTGFAALIWILSEPALLNFAPNQDGQLRIQLASVLPEGPTVDTPTNMLDQVTLLVLLLFLVLQGTVFVFGLLKLREIRLNQASAALKLRLLDNEENLFDLGLYVGLGGTVSSLVLVVLEFIDASLMAAYASTLFGIVFVAILKIGFLRPFRRGLIVAAEAQKTPQ